MIFHETISNIPLQFNIVTWLRCVALASLGSNAVVPASVGVLDEVSQVAEELGEGHLTGLVDRVVEQRSTPQNGVPPEQNTVDASQTFLCGIQGFQVVHLPARAATPWLVTIVNAAQIMSA